MTIHWLDRHTVFAPYLTLCTSAEEFRRVAEHCEIDSPGVWLCDQHRACTHTWRRAGKLTTVVCVSPEALEAADSVDVAASLVHEAVHVFQRLCDSIGERRPSREFEAYSIEQISGELMREFRRRLETLRMEEVTP